MKILLRRPASLLRRTSVLLLMCVAATLAGVAIFGPPSILETRESHASIRETDSDASDSPDQALRFRRLQLQDENGRIPLDGLLKAKAHMQRMKAAQLQRARAQGKSGPLEIARLDPNDWTWLGPGNVGGRIRSIVFDPTNSSSMWVGSVGGGIWHSTDRGASWNAVNDFLANLAVSTMAVNPANSTIMYAGTGEGWTNVDALQGGGVFQSTDRGVTWNQLSSTNPAASAPLGCGLNNVPCPVFWAYVNRLAISSNGSTILAATSAGIARSTDGGQTWTQVTANFTADVRFRPGDATQAIAGELGIARFSTNGGQTWQLATFAAPGISKNTFPNDGRVELAYAANGNPQVVYAAVNNNNGDVWKSTNGGQNFTRVNTGTSFFISTGSNQGWYDNAIWVNPQNSNFIVVGGIDLWRSTDGGTTLTKISDWQCSPGRPPACAGISAHSDHHVIVSPPDFDNNTNKMVYFGNDGGLFLAGDISTVATLTGWTSLNNNLGITQFYGGVATPSGLLVGGAQDNFTQTNPIVTVVPPAYLPQGWVTPTGAAGDGGFVAADPTDANYFYGEKQNLAVFRSSNAGSSVSDISAGITDAGNSNTTNFIAPLALDPNNPNTILAGGVSLWRSTNVKAATPAWSAIKAPIAPLPPAPGATPNPTPPISAIAVVPNNSNMIVVGHNDGRIFLSTNGTTSSPTWTRIDKTPAPARMVNRLVIDSFRTPAWIYATYGGFSPDNVYVTKDLGATWTDVSGTGTFGLPDVPVRSLILDPANPDLLYAGTEVGVFASEDAGATWQLPQGGPANVSVDELFFLPGGNLAAATHGRGFFMTFSPSFYQSKCSNPDSDCMQCSSTDWNCVCAWPNRQIPDQYTDIAVSCSMTLFGSGRVRNLSVGGRLTIQGPALLTVYGSLFNAGTIDAGNVDLYVIGDLVNAGTIVARSIRVDGNMTSGGTILAASSWNSNDEYRVKCNNNLTISGGSVQGASIYVAGVLKLGTAATLIAQSTNLSLPPALELLGNVFNNGFIDCRGQMDFTSVSVSGSAPHELSGAGQWKAGRITLGRSEDPYGSAVLLSLKNDLRFETTGLTSAFGNDSLYLNRESTITQNNHAFTIVSPSVMLFGEIDVGSGTLNLNTSYLVANNYGRTNIGPPGFVGAGIVNLTGSTNTYLGLAGGTAFQPTLYLVAGTFDGHLNVQLDQALAITANTTLNFNEGYLIVQGDVVVEGTLGKTSASNVFADFIFNGDKLTNDGSLTVPNIEFSTDQNGGSRLQTIVGFGAWGHGQSARFGLGAGSQSSAKLGNDLTWNFDNISIHGRCRIDTAGFTLTLPCNATFVDNGGGDNGEVIGNIRRPDVGTCSGAMTFGSPFTTIQFTSGTPPSGLVVSVFPEIPPGFPNAVQRIYSVQTTGGSGYSATMRFHYLDDALNGNDESALQLYRKPDVNPWAAQGVTARDTSDNWVQYAGVTGVPSFLSWALSAASPAIVDSDHDGMSDDFEQQYFGSATGGNPAKDDDGDGLTNLQEYLAGTNPIDAASFFRMVTAVKDSTGKFTVTFPTVAGKVYRVEYSNALGTGAMWMTLQNDIVGSGGDISVVDTPPNGTPKRFYRAVALP